MASNIEIKARITGDVDAVHGRAAAVADAGPTLIVQEDTFFVVSRGRLKLREFGGASGNPGGAGAPAELIYYERPDTEQPTASTYSLVAVPDPGALKATLAAAIGIRGVVRKRRTLYVAGETRIHIDDVDGLGAFLELEVVLPGGEGEDTGVTRDNQAPPSMDGMARCRELMDALRVADDDLIDKAYIDLLEEAHG